MGKVTAVILDLDGTLFDIDQRELHCINKALTTVGKPTFSTQSFIKEYYSNPYEQIGTGALLRRAIGDEVVTQQAIDVYRDEFWRTAHLNRLHAGVFDVLHVLRDKKMRVAIATLRARRAFVEQEIKQLQIDGFVDVLLVREDIGNPSGMPPSPTVITEARRRQFEKTLMSLRAEPDSTLIVGDSWWDIRAAKQVQVPIAWVKTGFGAYRDFSHEQPDITIGNLKELLHHINT